MIVLPSDFLWVPGWLPAGEADTLFDRLLEETPWEDVVLRMGGRLIPMPRRVAYFGPFDYVYSGLRHLAAPLPPVVDELARRIETGWRHPYNTVLMNLYRSGADSVSWHSDDDYPHGGHPAVASVSLGAPRWFRIAHRRDARERYRIELTHGGLLVMSGASQADYRHTLPKTASERGARINLTFRYMASTNAR